MGGVLAALLLAAVAAAVVLPDRLGLDDRTPFVQVIAFRPQIAVGLVVVAVLLGLAALTRGAALLAPALALGLVGVLGLAAVAPRAVGGDGAADAAADDGLTVLSLNTYVGRADPDAVADLVRDRSPDLVALPEAGGGLRRRLEGRLDDDAGGSGYRSFVADQGEDQSPMTVFVKRTLGRPTVTQDREGSFPGIVVDLPRGLRFVAVHPRSPRPGDTRAWSRDVADLARWCTDGRPTVVAGDMNATADHAEFRDATAACTDSGAATGDGLAGTWPSWVPRVLGAQIDHVLLAGGPRAVGFDVVGVPGTDHRAVVARIATG